MRRARGGLSSSERRQRPGRITRIVTMALFAAMLVIVVALAGGASLRPSYARGDEAGARPEYIPAGQEAPQELLPSAEQTKAALPQPSIGESGEPAETDLQVARELPHRNLGREEALELVEGVFGAQLEEPAGIFDGLEAKKFLSDNAAVVSSSSLPEAGGEAGQTTGELPPEGDVLLESSLPLRVENAEGEEEAVDLSLESPEGSGGALVPENPINEVEIPAHLGEGVTLPGPELGISVAGAPAEQTPSVVEGAYAFYPNVAEDTDLSVSPTPEGVEMLTDIRSADAPTVDTYELSLPEGAVLQAGEDGAAEVVERGKMSVLIPPPTATDAAGEPVPATQRVEGDNLVVEVSPAPSTPYPILVDPAWIPDHWNWTYLHESQSAWSPSSNDPGLSPIPYAFWETQSSPPNPNPAPGLDLTSAGWGNGFYGGQAQWVYAVPRYNEDYGHGYPPPTTWISSLSTENDWFLTHGNTETYPAMVVGLADPGSAGWWSTDNVWYGYYGDLYGGSMSSLNTTSDHATKAADIDFVTYATETPAKYRDSYVGAAYIAVVDEDAPTIHGLSAPTGWLTGSTAKTIGYSFEDTGLGVLSALDRLPGATSYWGASFNCTGTSASPCPRVASSTEAGRPALSFVPGQLPTGKDQLEVVVGDPFWGAGHEAKEYVTVDIDNTGPEISLLGPLSEQEGQGTLTGEYPLEIGVTDGSNEVPQSGVASVEVKVDGQKKTMPNETPWHPACKTENCSFSGEWTLKTSEYAAGAHQVEVIATDAMGHVSKSVIEVETGLEPLQTTITSLHPTYENKEIEQVSFAATREGKPVAGATFKCTLAETNAQGAVIRGTENLEEQCSSPFKLPAHMNEGWHTFTVAAKQGSSTEDPSPATWRFDTAVVSPTVYPPAPSSEKLIYPEEGKKTASYFTLVAGWGPKGASAEEEITGVTFQMKLPSWGTFQDVPTECAINSKGGPVSWPIRVKVRPGRSAPVYLKPLGCPDFAKEAKFPEKEIQFRAVFDGGTKAAGASAVANTEFVYSGNQARVATDATESIGPGSVDLLTGAFTMSATDVSIPVPGYETNLEFTRTYSSTMEHTVPNSKTVLGGAWQPSSPLETESEGEAWTNIQEEFVAPHPAVMHDECWEEVELTEREEEEGKEPYRTVSCQSPEHCSSGEECEEWVYEEAQPEEHWLELIDNEGSAVPIEMPGGPGGSLVLPEWANEIKLKYEGSERIVLSYPTGSHTVFVHQGGAEHHWTFVPHEFSFQASPTSDRMVYTEGPFGSGNTLVLKREIAPSPVECGDDPLETPGCRFLEFNYAPAEWVWEKFPGFPIYFFGIKQASVLLNIKYFNASGNRETAQTVAEYKYNSNYELIKEWDPRLPNLVTEYTYQAGSNAAVDQMTSFKAPGLEPWTFKWWEHEGPEGAKEEQLESVSRAGATTTVGYGVPVSGAGAPYDMSATEIARWGQSDLPVDATAIFPPTHVPASYPPSSYSGATIDYLDPDGSEVNAASPSPPGVEGASIATTETDQKGDVVRELDPQNRLIALQATNTAAKARELDTHSVYNAEGTEMLESWGPLHSVRVQATGEKVPARVHTTIHYDEGEGVPPAGLPPAYLPTKETVGGVVPGREGEIEPHTTVTKYNWQFRKPEETIVEPGGLGIRSVTNYNEAGLVSETKQPKAAAASEPTAGGEQTIYYSAGSQGNGGGHGVGEAVPAGCLSKAFANLPCEVLPAAQPSGSGMPSLLVKKFLAYNSVGEPEVVTEASPSQPAEVRTTTDEYDPAGRLVSTKISGGGVELARTAAKTETVYSSTLGAPIEQRFVCPGTEAACAGFNSRATKTVYNALGQVTGYADADGATTETTYDAFGRPTTVKDPRGTETLHYDESSGVLTSMEVSGIGTFTAAYDADGDLIHRGLPNGLTANTIYNVAGEPVELSYTKSSCSSKCTWYEETLERSVEGRILNDSATNNGALVTSLYKYDTDGRLEETQETPPSGLSVSRHYTFDADSNRLSKVAGGTPQVYTYDNADRLIGPTYDDFGRIISLSAELTGGKASEKPLETQYFTNDMVAKQTQSGVTNIFQLDATGRQRQREQEGGVTGVEVFHYDGPGDSPSWTALGSTWSRNVVGIGGELAAVQESSGTTTFKLTNLHGDVVASASSSPTATAPLAEYRADEFGEPLSGSSPGKYGWLGGKSRRTELPSGVIQMGARSYIPQLGRFLTPDPLRGGSANAYDYANQNPVSEYDLEGTCAKRKARSCKTPQAVKKAANRVQGTARVRVVTPRVQLPARGRTAFPGYHPPPKEPGPFVPPHIPGNPRLPTKPPSHHCPPHLAKATPYNNPLNVDPECGTWPGESGVGAPEVGPGGDFGAG